MWGYTMTISCNDGWMPNEDETACVQIEVPPAEIEMCSGEFCMGYRGF
jgi:hypothetical protein